MSKYVPLTGPVNASTALKQAAMALDIAASFYVYSKDPEGLTAIAAMWLNVAGQANETGKPANGIGFSKGDDDE